MEVGCGVKGGVASPTERCSVSAFEVASLSPMIKPPKLAGASVRLLSDVSPFFVIHS